MTDFWSSLAEGSFTGLLSGAGSLLKDVRTAITGKEPLSQEQQLEMVKQLDAVAQRVHDVEAKGQQGQIDLNLIDAKSGSLFKGGWRPALGWCCVFGLVYSFLIRTIFPWVVEVTCILMNRDITLPELPTLDTQELLGLTITLLGMGGFRTYEKIKGTAAK